MAQTFKLTATPRQRHALAFMLFHKDIKLKDRTKQRSLRRAQAALGLVALSEQIVQHQRVGEIWRDNTTRNVFEVTEDNADTILEQADRIEKTTADLLYLQEVLDQLQDKKDAPDAESCQPIPADEPERWKPDLLGVPIADNLVLWADFMRESLQGSLSYGAFREAVLKVLEAAKAQAQEAKSEAA